MRTLLRIVIAVLAAGVFSLVYLIALALEARRDLQARQAGGPPPESATPSETDS